MTPCRRGPTRRPPTADWPWPRRTLSETRSSNAVRPSCSESDSSRRADFGDPCRRNGHVAGERSGEQRACRSDRPEPPPPADRRSAGHGRSPVRRRTPATQPRIFVRGLAEHELLMDLDITRHVRLPPLAGSSYRGFVRGWRRRIGRVPTLGVPVQVLRPAAPAFLDDGVTIRPRTAAPPRPAREPRRPGDALPPNEPPVHPSNPWPARQVSTPVRTAAMKHYGQVVHGRRDDRVPPHPAGARRESRRCSLWMAPPSPPESAERPQRMAHWDEKRQ